MESPTFESLTKNIEKISTLDSKLTKMSKKSNEALNSLMVLKFMKKYQNLNSTSYNKNTPAFYKIDENLNLVKNISKKFTLENQKIEEIEEKEILEEISKNIDSEMEMPKFEKIEDFVNFNKKRSEMIQERFKKLKNDKKFKERKNEKNKRDEVELQADVPDAGKRFNVVTVTNKKLENVQNLFKEYLESCLEIARDVQNIKNSKIKYF